MFFGWLTFFIIDILLLFYMWRRYFMRATWTESIINDHTYPTLVGDNIKSYGASYTRFNGVEIFLTRKLPHIYLDSLDGGGRQVQYYPDPKQILTLEGDFSQHYRVFVPSTYETLAMSILSPDVMQTILQFSHICDVEIYKDRLRIISNRHVHGDRERQQELLSVANSILKELDHRLQSWPLDSTDEYSQDLTLYPMRAFRFGRVYIRKIDLIVFSCLSPGLLGLSGLAMFYYLHGQLHDALNTLIALVLIFCGFWTCMILLGRTLRVKGRDA